MSIEIFQPIFLGLSSASSFLQLYVLYLISHHSPRGMSDYRWLLAMYTTLELMITLVFGFVCDLEPLYPEVLGSKIHGLAGWFGPVGVSVAVGSKLPLHLYTLHSFHCSDGPAHTRISRLRHRPIPLPALLSRHHTLRPEAIVV